MEKKFVSKLFAITLLLSTPLIVASEDGNGNGSTWTDVIDRAAEQALQNVTQVVEQAPVAETATTDATHTAEAAVTPVVEQAPEAVPVEAVPVVEPAPAVTPVVEADPAQTSLEDAAKAATGTAVAKEVSQQVAHEVAQKAGRLQRVLKVLKQFGADRTEEGKNAVAFLSDIVRNPRAHKVALAIAAESALPTLGFSAFRNEQIRKSADTSLKTWVKNRALDVAFFAFNAWLTAYTIKNAAALKNPRQKAQFAKEIIAVAAKLGIHWKLSVPYVKSFFARWNPKTK